MAKDLVQIDRGALTDLIEAVRLLTDIVAAHPPKNPTDEENKRIDYISKLVCTARKSFEENNPHP